MEQGAKQIKGFILLIYQGHWEICIFGRVGFRGIGHDDNDDMVMTLKKMEKRMTIELISTFS
jgi:hypothetical protein